MALKSNTNIIPKYSDSRKIAVIILKFEKCGRPKDADGIANSVDPDQTVWSGFALFAKTCLSVHWILFKDLINQHIKIANEENSRLCKACSVMTKTKMNM